MGIEGRDDPIGAGVEFGSVSDFTDVCPIGIMEALVFNKELFNSLPGSLGG